MPYPKSQKVIDLDYCSSSLCNAMTYVDDCLEKGGDLLTDGQKIRLGKIHTFLHDLSEVLENRAIELDKT